MKGKITELSQTNGRYKSDSLLSDLIQERRIRHYGSEVLRDHLSSVEMVENVRGIRMSKQPHGGDIDAAVALAQACFLAVKQGNIGSSAVKVYSHNPFFSDSEDLVDSPYGKRDAYTSQILSSTGEFISLKTALSKHPEGITWRNCRRRTKGCPYCRLELEAEGYYSAQDKQKWLRENK